VTRCIHCNEPNDKNWFYCRNCDKRASESKYTTNMYMMSEIGKRTDIEFSTTTIEESAKKMRKQKWGKYA
jgi:hypothetical protein